MRLTLRNLLAYMHHMMTPEDQASFQTLLAASPRAQALLARCQEVARQRKLAALSIEQPCERHSAVAVSNYLDHQMQDQHLGPFEHSALHSDEQLAEIVDCHRVIADLVAHRVQVQPAPWKERLRLLARQHNPHVPAPTSEHAATGTPENAAPTFAEHEYKLCSMMDIAKVERAVEETLLHDSADLTKEIADDEELSECAARQRDRWRQKQANASLKCGQETRPTPKYAWPQQATAMPGAPKGIAEEKEPDVQSQARYELAVPLPLLVGGLGGLLLIGGVVWLCW